MCLGSPNAAIPITIYSSSFGLYPNISVTAEYNNPKDQGYLREYIFFSVLYLERLPWSAYHIEVVSHSPIASTTITFAFRNGDV